jgi:hypothetical protein
MKISRWKKYDAGSGLWIASSKPLYGYWFRFLIHAENDPNRVVDWSLYESWGGKDVILRTTQNEWWKKNWKTLFGYKDGVTKPLYSLSNAPSGKTTRPQPDGIRLALMVYELRDTPLLNGQVNDVDGVVGDKWEIAKGIAVSEYPRRKAKAKTDPSYDPDDWVFHYARKAIASDLRKTGPAKFSKQKRTLQSRVGRYMSAAEKHLDNVCRGQFP